MIEINGKVYPMWSQLVEQKARWIGGVLQDRGDSMDRAIGLTDGSWSSTEIVNIELLPNGTESAQFVVTGKEFECAADVRYLGVTGGEEGYLTFNGYGGHTWRIKPRQK